MNWKNCANRILSWDKRSNDFVPITPIKDMRVYEERCINPEQLDLNGITLRLSYRMITRIVEPKNDSNKITGYFGEAWHLLEDYLNFTTLPRNLDNYHDHSVSGTDKHLIYNLMKLNKTDIGIPILYSADSAKVSDYLAIGSSCYRLHVPPNFKSNDAWIFEIIEYNALLVILIIIIFMSLMSFYIYKYRVDYKNVKNDSISLCDHFFHIFATFVNQDNMASYCLKIRCFLATQNDSAPPMDMEEFSRIFTMTKRIFAWLFLIMATANLFSSMSKTVIDAPFSDIPSFFDNSNMKIIIRSESPGWQDSVATVSATVQDNRIKFVNSIPEMYNDCLKNINTALWQSEYIHDTVGHKFGCNLVPVGACTARGKVGFFAISKNFHFKRSFLIGLMKIRESGLMDTVKNHWLTPRRSVVPEGYKRVSLKDLKPIFFINLMGVSISMIILVIEKITCYQKRHRLQRKWSQKI